MYSRHIVTSVNPRSCFQLRTNEKLTFRVLSSEIMTAVEILSLAVKPGNREATFFFRLFIDIIMLLEIYKILKNELN